MKLGRTLPAGTTYGGASLVVKPEITEVSQLAGKKIATPQLGNTQDVAAKAYFKEEGVEGVEILNQENAQTLDLLKRGEIDGGWVPEPWASRLQIEGGGKVLVDEASLWPEGKFVTTHLVVRQDYLAENPTVVEALLKGLIAATEQVATKSPEVQKAVNEQIAEDTGKALPEPVLQASFEHLTPSLDPIAPSLIKSAEDATAVGVSRSAPDLAGIYDLRPFNALLKAAGEQEVAGEPGQRVVDVVVSVQQPVLDQPEQVSQLEGLVGLQRFGELVGEQVGPVGGAHRCTWSMPFGAVRSAAAATIRAKSMTTCWPAPGCPPPIASAWASAAADGGRCSLRRHGARSLNRARTAASSAATCSS